MDLGLRGRTALIPASSAGLGFATARALVAEGVRVHLCGSNRARLDAAVDALGRPATGTVVDLSVAGAGRVLVESALDELGGLDILVTNAPGPRGSSASALDAAAAEEALRLNFLSAVELCTASVPTMLRAGWGRIVAITSLGAREPSPGLAGSGAARAALTAYLKLLSDEVRDRGITVNSVQPGPHETMRYVEFARSAAASREWRVGSPAHLGAIVAFLCSEQADHVSGVGVPVAGGYQATC